MTILKIEKLTKRFGGLTALDSVDMEVKAGQITGLIGPNGAGKTTIFNIITGFLRPSAGKVIFESKDITGSSPHTIAKLGLVRTFQASILFNTSTVLENVMLARHLHVGSILRRDDPERDASITEIMKFMDLWDYKDEQAKNLTHGYQRKLGIAIALATEAKLMLLDEPITGMVPVEAMELMDKIRELKERGKSMLLVDHNMQAIMGICERVIVLNFGKKIAEGRPIEIQQNKDVIEAYLGTEHIIKSAKVQDSL